MKGSNTDSRNLADSHCEQAVALEDAFARFHGELIGTLYYMVGNKEDASDALQETFLKCWRHREKVAEINQLKSWIFRIAINTARDLRQTAWRRKRSEMEDEQGIADSADRRPETILGEQEDIKRLREAIEDLRDEEKEIFLLRQNGDLTYDEIGEALDLPTGTVKTRMRLAISKLRSAVAPSKARPG